MPKLTRWYLRTALLWLAAALTLALAGALSPGLLPPLVALVLRPVYLHAFMFGWVAQLIFGVVYWMFPKPSPATARRTERLGWLTWGLLNGGLLLRVVSEPALGSSGSGDGWPAASLALAALLQLVAGWLFVATTWPRVRVR